MVAFQFKVIWALFGFAIVVAMSPGRGGSSFMFIAVWFKDSYIFMSLFTEIPLPVPKFNVVLKGLFSRCSIAFICAFAISVT